MKNLLKVFLAVFGLPLFAFLVIVITIAYFIGQGCENSLYSQALSPDGQHKAVVYQRYCGILVGPATRVAIIDVDEAIEDVGEGFFMVDGSPSELEFKVRWVADDELFINRDLDGTEQRAADSVGFFSPITVTYRDSL